MSRTNIDLDEELVAEALRLTNLKTKREVVNFALSELVRMRKRREILKLEGRVSWEGSLDAMRMSRV